MVGDLRLQVLEDLETTIQSDWGQEIKISRPDGSDAKIFIGNTNDVYFSIDPSTGEPVTSRVCQAVFKYYEVVQFYGEIPRKNWIVEFVILPGGTFRVKDYKPDRTLGVLTLMVGD